MSGLSADKIVTKDNGILLSHVEKKDKRRKKKKRTNLIQPLYKAAFFSMQGRFDPGERGHSLSPQPFVGRSKKVLCVCVCVCVRCLGWFTYLHFYTFSVKSFRTCRFSLLQWKHLDLFKMQYN